MRLPFSVFMAGSLALFAAHGSSAEPRDSAYDLQAAIDHAKSTGAAEVVVPAGVHRIDAMLRLHGLKDFTLIGGNPESPKDTVLLFTDIQNGGISVSDCDRLALRGFTVDFDPLPFTQGTIDAIDLEKGVLTYTVHEGYPDITPLLASARAHIFSPDTLAWKPTAPDIYADSFRILSPRRASLTFGKDKLWQLRTLSVGDYIAQDQRHQMGALRVEPASDITVSGINILSSPGVAMVLRFMSGQNRFEHITITPGPPPAGATVPRLMSSSADGFNYAYARAGPVLENCDFSRMGDDSVNIHGIAFAVAETGTDPQLGLYVTMVRPYGGERFPSIIREGDEIRALSGINFEITGHARIVRIGAPRTSTAPPDIALGHRIFPLHGTLDKVTFYKIYTDIPLSPGTGDLVEVPAIDGSGYTIRGNHFHEHRARALRLMGSNGLVENNVIENIKQAPVTLGAEFVGFREAGWVENVVLRGNTIRNSAFDPILTRGAAYTPGAISLIYQAESSSAPNPRVARNRSIIIEQNTITDVGGPAIHINQSSDVIIRENHIDRTNLVKDASSGNRLGLSTSGPIGVNNSIRVSVDGAE